MFYTVLTLSALQKLQDFRRDAERQNIHYATRVIRASTASLGKVLCSAFHGSFENLVLDSMHHSLSAIG